MKPYLNILLVPILIGWASSRQAAASASETEQIIFLLSSNFEDTWERDFETQLREYLIPQVDSGTRISFIDTDTRSVIAEMQVPEYSGAKRNYRLKTEYAMLRRWFSKNAAQDTRANGSQTLKYPEMINQLNLPLSAATRIVVCGSPIYENPEDPQFNFVMKGYRTIPSRESFRLSPAEHPFGVIGARNLNGAHLYFLHDLGADEDLDNRYQVGLTEFLNDWVGALNSGGLHGITRDQRSLMTRLSEPVSAFERIAVVDEQFTGRSAPAALPSRKLPKITRVFLVDNSMSQTPVIEKIQSTLSQQTESPYIRYALVLFTNPDATTGEAAYLYRESSNPQEMAEAFRVAPRDSGGMDSADALSDGMRITCDLLQTRKAYGVEILIFADVAPAESGTRPTHLGYPSLIKELQQAGHRVQFVPTYSDTPTKWLPAGVTLGSM